MNKIFTGKMYLRSWREREREEKKSQSERRANRKRRWTENYSSLPFGKWIITGKWRDLPRRLTSEPISYAFAKLDFDCLPFENMAGWHCTVEQDCCTCQARITTENSPFSFNRWWTSRSLFRPLSAFSCQCFWFAFHLEGGIEDGKESIGVVSSFSLSLLHAIEQTPMSLRRIINDKQTNNWSILGGKSTDGSMLDRHWMTNESWLTMIILGKEILSRWRID